MNSSLVQKNNNAALKQSSIPRLYDVNYENSKKYVPGPGNYELNPNTTAIPQKSDKRGYMGSKLPDLAERERARMPGPGQFDPH